MIYDTIRYDVKLLCRSYSHRCDLAGNSHKECSECEKVTAKNAHLNRRVDELMVERDSALQDSQDLLSGMQVRN